VGIRALPRLGRAVASLVWLLAAGLLLAACSRPPVLPGRFFGLAFGEAPPAGLVRQAVPLPAALAEDLVYCTAPGRRETLWDTALAEPVLAFYQGRFFSLDAALADETAAPGLRERLTRDFGPPHCREAAGSRTYLWQAGEVDLIVETGPAGPARLMVRHGPTAAAVAAVLPREADAGRSGEGALDRERGW
jgi:hypothetical protein